MLRTEAEATMHTVRATSTLLQFVLTHAVIRTNVCTRQQWDDGYTLEPRILPDDNLIFVTRGKVVWVLDDEPVELTPQHMVLVRRGVRHHAFSRTDQVTLGSLHIDVLLPGGKDALALLLPPSHQPFDLGSRLDRYLRGFLDEFERPDEAEIRQMTPGWARLILPEMLRARFEDGTLQQVDLEPLVTELLELLQQRLAEPTTLDDLARHAGYSPQHVNRTFRAVLGVTPLQYLTRMRMERAAALLSNGRLKVRAIAAAVGFDDPYYFSRVFRQHFDQSPAQFRDALDQPPR